MSAAFWRLSAFGLWNFSLSSSRIALVKTGHNIADTVKPHRAIAGNSRC
jgi:hypothetical protein